MANLDTREKRSSGTLLSLPWRGLLPLPDGTVGQPDRQHIAFYYSAIQAAEPVEVVEPGPIFIDNATVRGGIGGGKILDEGYRRTARNEIAQAYAEIIEGIIPERDDAREIEVEALQLVKPYAKVEIPSVDQVKWDLLIERTEAVNAMLALRQRIQEIWDEEAAVLLLMAA